ncbi:hypothetical protein HOG98_01235 [bacterium]|jgi:hemerythrin|nr:hypothetical protein [bacterium]
MEPNKDSQNGDFSKENKIWSDDLQVGDPAIDNQHQEVFLLTQLLDQAVRNSSVIEKILTFLVTYTDEHFSDEEALMSRQSFEGIDEHKDAHELFRVMVIKLKNDYESSPEQASKLIFPIRKLIDEIIDHIIHVDYKLKALRQNEINPS